MKWFVGADHAGVELKDQLVSALHELGDEIDDLGTHSQQSVDYPDFAAQVSRGVVETPGALGLLVCGTGTGMAITANKVPGIRAAVATCAFTASAARSHNDANVLAVGSRVVGAGLALEVLKAFRDTDFEGGRHQRRVDLIAAVEQNS